MQIVGALLGAAVFCGALWILYHQLRSYRLQDVSAALRAIPSGRIICAVALTLLSYLVMSGYDFLALQYIRQPLSWSKIALASFISYGFSNNMGFGMIAGSSVRYRLYSAWGLSILQISQVVVFCTLTLWLGFLTLAGTAFLLEPSDLPRNLHLPFSSTAMFGVLFLGLLLAYFLWNVFRKKPLKLAGWEFSLPPLRLFGAQILLSTADWALAAAVLYVLLPELPQLSFGGFLPIYLLAQTLGLISQVPGGLGVFETAILLLLSPHSMNAAVLGSLLAYRAVYYLLPLGMAAILLAFQEILRKRTGWLAIAKVLGQWGAEAIPHVLSLAVFASGALLLFSGATPVISSRLAWLRKFIPLPVQEISHFLGSLIGMGLLLLARGLQLRLDAAYLLSLVLLALGIFASIFKGLDYDEAAVLTVMLLTLVPVRHHFYRKASLFDQRFSVGWTAAVIIVLLCSLWFVLFSYRHLEYSRDLWWRFTLHGDAPSSLRAMVGAVALLLFFSLATLLRPARPESGTSGSPPTADILPIVKASPEAKANLATLGDKLFLLNPEKTAFIMYRSEGRSWVAMGDPVGPRQEWIELIWRFREICDRHRGWPVFYQVAHHSLYMYLDLGLKLLKLGEEARVALASFSLEGHARKELRYMKRKFEREGFAFKVIPPQQLPALLPRLRQISDAWLTGKNTREKGFSLGFFDEDYIGRFAVGIVFKGEAVLAFANIWQGAGLEECAVDLMRQVPDAPNGMMDYLFTELMLWSRQQGYQWFNMGMAPLAGLENRDLAPLWSRLGAFVFQHGEHFYNFKGLRDYKSKFGPVWEPRYLAVPGAVALPRIFANLAALISGGLAGVVSR